LVSFSVPQPGLAIFFQPAVFGYLLSAQKVRDLRYDFSIRELPKTKQKGFVFKQKLKIGAHDIYQAHKVGSMIFPVHH
jgi:hypothetical protein